MGDGELEGLVVPAEGTEVYVHEHILHASLFSCSGDRRSGPGAPPGPGDPDHPTRLSGPCIPGVRTWRRGIRATTCNSSTRTGTRASFKTTELIAYVAAVLGVLIASAVVDTSDFGAQEAWFYITLLTIGYLVSRGLAKSGSRDFYDDYADGSNR